MNAGGTPHRRRNSAKSAEEAVRCFELRLDGLTFSAIGAEVGLAVSTVHARIEAHIAERVNPLADELRAIELDRLDRAIVRVFEVLAKTHVVVQNGKVVTGADGRPLVDDMPALQAIDRLIRISERRCKMLGLDAPTPLKADVTLHQVDPRDLELMQLIEAAKERNAVIEAQLRGTPLAPGAEGLGDGTERAGE